jgi:hypothetical protein
MLWNAGHSAHVCRFRGNTKAAARRGYPSTSATGKNPPCLQYFMQYW